jgi:hypothetical protein
MRTSTSELLRGKTPQEQVAKMRETTFFPEKDTRTFMRFAAKRAKVQTGKTVRCDNAANFIADLEAAGLLEK